MLSTAVKLWTRNLVIRQWVKDFELSIESYQTRLNLTKLGWDATGYEFKHDYTIIESPRVVVFPVNNNEQKIMRFNKIYKFSDGTLTRILEELAYKVKDSRSSGSIRDFFEVDALPSTNNEDKEFNPGILIRENLFEVITHVAQEKNVKKLAISHASLILEDFDPPHYELPFFKEVLGAKTLLPFSFKNKEKVFKP
nr:hypothetical protein [Tanacetum cinerariifolium]